jgi:hypothetical protein
MYTFVYLYTKQYKKIYEFLLGANIRIDTQIYESDTLKFC